MHCHTGPLASSSLAMVNKWSLGALLLKPLHWPQVRQLKFLLCFVLKVVESVRKKKYKKSFPIFLLKEAKRVVKTACNLFSSLCIHGKASVDSAEDTKGALSPKAMGELGLTVHLYTVP